MLAEIVSEAFRKVREVRWNHDHGGPRPNIPKLEPGTIRSRPVLNAADRATSRRAFNDEATWLSVAKIQLYQWTIAPPHFPQAQSRRTAQMTDIMNPAG